MNKILFGVIGLLFLGVLGTGIIALRAPSSNEDAVTENPPSLETSGSVTTTPDGTTGTPVKVSPSPTPSPTPTPTPAPTPAPAPKPGTYTMAQVAAHNSQTSCYTVVQGSVYDVTSFISQHPGGARAILSLCGRDGTAAFEGQHGGQGRPAAELASFKIGTLAP